MNPAHNACKGKHRQKGKQTAVHAILTSQARRHYAASKLSFHDSGRNGLAAASRGIGEIKTTGPAHPLAPKHNSD